MTPLRATYFDGRLSAGHTVSVLLAGGRVRLIGQDVDADFDARRVRLSPRVGRTPRWLYLPGGAACAIDDDAGLEAFARETPFARALQRCESHAAWVALALGLVAALLWLLLDRGLPFASRHIAHAIPPQAEAVLGDQTLAGLEGRLLLPSRLSPARQELLRAKFQRLVRQAGERFPHRIEFRASPVVGPNALALPSGIIVVTDELVHLAGDDREILAVMAHELGHVRHRHTMRQLLEASATALVVTGITGDVSSASSLAAAAPALLLQMKYSRENESEADAYGLDLLAKGGIGAQHFATILGEMQKAAPASPLLPGFLSSHPGTEERRARALARGAAPSVREADSGQAARSAQ